MKYKIYSLALMIIFSCSLSTSTFAAEMPSQQSTPTGFVNDSFEKFFLEQKTQSKIPIMLFTKNTIPTVSTTMDFAAYENEISFVEEYKKISQNILDKGMEYLGIRYRRGGSSENTGFDCSGFVKNVYEHSVGLILPRTAMEMSKIGEQISNVNNLKPGDLVFFNTMKKQFSHVGIYIGNNKFMHSPRKGTKVRIENIDKKYWTPRFNGGRRIVPEASSMELFKQ